MMAAVAVQAESIAPYERWNQSRVRRTHSDPAYTIAHNLCDAARELRLDALVIPTLSGRSARLVSAHRPTVPIYALSPGKETVRRCGLMWGVQAASMPRHETTEALIADAARRVVELGWCERGQRVGITAGLPSGRPGTTSLFQIQVLRERRGDTAADVLVIFGITGDLAKVMTFRSLYRLERRGLLDCPIVGVAVDDWTIERLREHARECIEGHGRDSSTTTCSIASPRACPMSAATSPTPPPTSAWPSAIGDAHSPVFYLEIPPFLFGPGDQGTRRRRLDEDALAWSSRSRSATISPRPVRSRRKSTSTSTSHSCIGSTTSSARWAPTSCCTCGSPTR